MVESRKLKVYWLALDDVDDLHVHLNVRWYMWDLVVFYLHRHAANLIYYIDTEGSEK